MKINKWKNNKFHRRSDPLFSIFDISLSIILLLLRLYLSLHFTWSSLLTSSLIVLSLDYIFLGKLLLKFLPLRIIFLVPSLSFLDKVFDLVLVRFVLLLLKSLVVLDKEFDLEVDFCVYSLSVYWLYSSSVSSLV